jgi:heme-degrading monooxygenase HmoA
MEQVVPEIGALNGNISVQILERTDGDVIQFIVLSWWESMDAIRAFAGTDIDLAQYSPEDKEYLIDFETHVVHYEVTTVNAPKM